MAHDYAIRTENLTKVFVSRWTKREVLAVNGIGISVPRGVTFGLLGPNGAGKTTFVKMLLSAIHPTAGTAEIFGLPAEFAQARRPIGYLPENHRFPTYFTGAGMLDCYAALSGMESGERRRRIPAMLELVGLKDWGDVRLGKYSKGMLQRVGLAQALIHAPDLLILDEPTDGVDPVGRRHIREILKGLEQRGVTIFINSHMLAEVELFCERVAIINKGKLALEGSVKELTAGRGYRLTTVPLDANLADAVKAKGASLLSNNGTFQAHFATREMANDAIDLLRSEHCDIESLVPTTSTLEDVFVKTVEGRNE